MAGETIINNDNNGTVINEGNAFSSKLRTAVNTAADNTGSVKGFNTDDVVAQRYRVIGIISRNSGEADIYKVLDLNDGNAVKVLKLFRRQNAIKSDVITRLMSLDSPYVADFSDTGTIDDHTYLVMPYYSKGSLASYIERGVTFSAEEIRKLILPSVIRGLKAIHDLGIIHKDLKPGNMMIADDESHIVLIDFGISSVTDGNTMVVTQTGKSPFYSAPETATGLFWSGSDYYSLGISLYELHTGTTPYGNADINDVSRYALSQKIPYPDNFDPDLRDLIDGLTFKDISYRNDPDNPNRRWDYDETELWLQGKKLPVPGKTSEAGSGLNTYPYIFSGKKYFNADDIAKALAKSWNSGKKEVFRGFLTRYFETTDNPRAVALCRRAEEEFGQNPDRADAIFFRLLYGLSPKLTELTWGCSDFPDLETYARKLKNSLTGKGSNHLMASARQLLEDKTIDAYVRNVGGDDAVLINRHLEQAKILAESFIRKFGNDSRHDTDRYIALILSNTLLNQSTVIMGQKVFEGFIQFRAYMQKLSQDPMRMVTFCHDNADSLKKAAATLPPNEYNELKPFVPILYDDAEKDALSMFYFDDYVFRNTEEAVAYCNDLRNKATKTPKQSAQRAEYNGFKKGFDESVRKFVTDGMELRAILNKCGTSVYPHLSGDPQTNRIVEFGSYSLGKGMSRIPIQWLVLDNVKSKGVLLVSKDVLKIRRYDAPLETPLQERKHTSSSLASKIVKALVFWPVFSYLVIILCSVLCIPVVHEMTQSGNAVRKILELVIMLPLALPYSIAEFVLPGMGTMAILLTIAYIILVIIYRRRIISFIDNRFMEGDGQSDGRWAGSTMRRWMNTELIDELFTVEEQQFIQKVRVQDGDSLLSRVYATSDRLFLLSVKEVREYLPDRHTAAAGLYGSPVKMEWWLRDLYYRGSNRTIDRNGWPSSRSHSYNFTPCGVRPAMWLNMEKDSDS